MTRARNVLVADRCRSLIHPPMGVYGPTRKTSISPITSGGSSRLHRIPASQMRGNGSLPRASIQASGVPSSTRTPRVTSPDWSETISGSRAPGLVSELLISPGDTWVIRAMTGPSSITQMTAAPAMEAAADTRRSNCGLTVAHPAPAEGRCPGGSPRAALPAAARLAELTTYRRGDGTGRAERRGFEHVVSPLLVQGQPGRRQHVLDVSLPGRAWRGDRGDVDDER